MDRDVAQLLLTKLTAIKTALQNISTNTNPSIVTRSVSDDQQRTLEIEEPEPVTNEKK